MYVHWCFFPSLGIPGTRMSFSHRTSSHQQLTRGSKCLKCMFEKPKKALILILYQCAQITSSRSNTNVLQMLAELHALLRPVQTNLCWLSTPLGVKRLQFWGGGSTSLLSILHPQTSAHGWGKKPVEAR